mmetsp:Transcript_95479/g.169523  ORF Transcript_95479/g.169523 Transcript_95479/m.169523 type:complete len:324 (-) Transcript_95479:46-1017(-)
MNVGEEAEIFSISRMAFGPDGYPAIDPDEKPVPRDADVRFKVCLQEILPAVPADRSRQEWLQRVQELEWRKVNGNDHFRRKKLDRACKCYSQGLQIFPEVPIIAPASLGRSADSAAAAVTKVIADIASNMAAVLLEQEKFRDALSQAEIATDLIPEHPKGLYRRAKAHMHLGEFEKCDVLLQQLKPLQPDDPGVKRLVADLTRARAKHAAKSKQFGAALLETAGDARSYEKPKPEEEESDPETFAGMIRSMLPDGKLVLLFLVLIVISVMAIAVSPVARRPKVIIGAVLGSAMIFAIGGAMMSLEEESQEERKKAKKETKKNK